MYKFQNISKLPIDVQAKVEAYGRKLLDLHAANILSIIVYGSASGCNYIAGVSDINIAVVFKALDFSVFKKSIALSALGRKYKISAPLFLTKEYIQKSLDVFPIEFSEIRDRHLVILGEDLFSTLVIDGKHVRLFCEMQIKGKLLRIRQSYLESGDHPKALKLILSDSLNSLIPIFRQLLSLKGNKPSIDKEEILKELGRVFTLDITSFLAIYQDKSRLSSLNHTQTQEYLENYLQQLEALAHHVDLL